MRAVMLTWVGGHHAFRLRIGELRALQQATNAGPEELFNRLRSGRWRIDDIVQVLRWGLVGGETIVDGKPISDGAATQLVLPLVDLHPHADLKMTALAVLGAGLFGVDPDDPVGEPEGATENAPEN